MGISTSVLFITDEQIQSFIEEPSNAEKLFIGCSNFDEEKCCHLHDYWDGLNYLLVGEAEGGDLPLCAIRRGDVSYTDVEDPTHAIYSTTTKALTQELNTISEQELRERYDPRRMLKAASGGRHVYPGRLWMHSEPDENIFRDLLSYFSSLRRFAAWAAEKDVGLLFCRHEDL